MNEAHVKSLLSDLIFLAQADGVIDPSEHDFIHRIGHRMGLDFDTIEALFEAPEPSVPLFTELERITHFHKLLLLMNVDRETHKNEVIVLKNFALKMGIRPGAIDTILERMNDHPDKLIPSDELIRIFQTYYN